MILIPEWLERRAERWEELSRWERTEVGRELRRLGLSYGEIMEIVPVPKGTLAGWCRHITITADQAAAIKARTGSVAGVPRDTQWRRRMEIATIRRKARLEAAALVHEPLWIAGTSLYWGEGEKSHRRLAMTNTDPSLLRVFARWVEHYLIAEPVYALSLHLHEGNPERAAMTWWTEQLRLDQAYFTKTFRKPSRGKEPKNTHVHGLCRIIVRRSTDAFVRAAEWIERMREGLITPDMAPRPTASLPAGSLAQFGRATDS